MKGCQAILWALMISPLVLVIVLFSLSWRTGLIGLGIVIGAATVYFGAAFFTADARRLCPACKNEKLKCINFFKANPPPNFSFYRCDQCETEFVEVHGQTGLVERSESPFKDSDGWDAT